MNVFANAMLAPSHRHAPRVASETNRFAIEPNAEDRLTLSAFALTTRMSLAMRLPSLPYHIVSVKALVLSAVEKKQRHGVLLHLALFTAFAVHHASVSWSWL